MLSLQPCRPFGSSSRFWVLCAAILCCTSSGLAQSPTTTTLAITVNGNPLTNTIGTGVAVTLTAVVTSGGTAVMPAQVNFCDAAPPNCTGIHLLGIAQMTRAGTAITKFIPGPGTHNVQAIFPGTNGNLASSSAVTPLVVGPLDPTTIQYGGGPGNYTLSAFVEGSAATFPSGIITFIDTSNANYVLGTSTLMPGMGSFGGELLITQSVSAFPTSGIGFPGVAAGDFNGDGILDVAIGDSALNILFGHGDLTFTELPGQPIAGAWVSTIAAGDFNQDGKTDLVASQFDGTNAFTYVLLGNGDGTFTEPQVINGLGVPNLAVADLNGDGIPDLILSAGGTQALGTTIMLGNGDGTFTTKSSYATGATGMPIVGDFNADGKIDLALPAAGGKTVVYLGNGDGTFTASALSAPANTALLPGQADFNGDGFLETATAIPSPPNQPPQEMILQFLRTVPTSEDSFAPGVPGIFIVGTGPHQIAAVYGGDTIYFPTTSPSIPLTALPEPTTLSLTANPSTFNQFQPAVLTATLTPHTAQNHNATGIVTFMAGTTVVGTASIANGIATLTTNKFPAGNDNVIAIYPGDTNFSASSSSPIAVSVVPVDFTLTLASPTLTIQTQHHLTTTATLASINSFTDSITLTCPKPPTNITCQFTPTPAILASNGATTVSLYLDTDSIQGFARNTTPAIPHSRTAPITLAFTLFAGIATLRKRRIRPRLLLLLFAAIPTAVILTGCGEIIIPPPSVLPGIYTIPITATAAATGVVHTAQITLTVTR
jgi:trimeric autotransporter adhesin